MIKNVGSKSKFKVHWKVSPYDYSKDALKNIENILSKKYNISKDSIKIEPNFISLNEKGEEIPLTSSIIENIQEPKFQLELFKEYLRINDIVDYDFSKIEGIDNEINNLIDYKVYDKFRKYSINWVKWDNFLSYGEGNFFDFSSLKGLILLNGEPANQSGKTTFAIDLIHFLLFGRTDRTSTQDKIFNRFLPESTKVTVEGSITIDGVEYIINRELKRTSFDKRTSASRTNQKVKYYRVITEGQLEELEEYIEDESQETSKTTNKAIKDAIGNEDDFDMIICATSSNLDDLIEKKDTERGRILSRWIGLLPIEEKDKVARDRYNSTIKKSFLMNHYNSDTLKSEIKILEETNISLNNSIKKYTNEFQRLEISIKEKNDLKEQFLSTKKTIDETILKLDKTSIENNMVSLRNKGIEVNNLLQNKKNEFNEVKDVEFSNIEYDKLVEENNQYTTNIAICRAECKSLKNEIDILKKSEYCPTCGRKLDDIDNSEKIKQKETEFEQKVSYGKNLSEKQKEITSKVEKLKELREKFNIKNNLVILISKLEVDITNIKTDYAKLKEDLRRFNENSDGIKFNTDLDIKINNIKSEIKNLENTKETTIRYIENNTQEVIKNNEFIKQRNEIISKINEEIILDKHWRIYLDMIGKNGISKMALRKTLPIINAELSNLLSDICDFTVYIDITDKNEVIFNLIKDGKVDNLMSGSGFEKTASALALRYVLGKISTLPKNSGIILDEIWGRVAKENYDNIQKLLDKMLQTYDYIFIITHLDEVKDYCDKIVTVTKINNISKIDVIK